MASNAPSHSGGDGDGNPQRSWQQRQTRSSEIAASHRRQNDDSWVELASQPSSSSLSSIGDEIVTTGLRVTNSYPPRRRRLQPTQNHMPSTYMVSHAAAQAGTSSQEEYDETESEEDHGLSSSNEQLSPSAPLPRQQTAIGPTVAHSESDDDGGSDDDENSTALGVRRSSQPSTSPTFRPEPNAFSHPPSHLHRHSTSSAVPQYSPSSRPPMSQRAHTHSRSSRGAPNIMSPAYQADNDAALRASLTTLLSCARALPKKEQPVTVPQPGASTQPLNLRFAPESELMGGPATTTPHHHHPPHPHQAVAASAAIPPHLRPPVATTARTASNSSAPSAAPSSTSSHHDPPPGPEKPTKRERERPAATTTPAARAKSPRAAKKKQRTASPSGVVDSGATTSISPTVLTWVVSAGVLVLVSVVGFGAGYVIGREVGRQEGLAGGMGGFATAAGGGGGGIGGTVGGNATSCGREVIRTSSSGTLRRFKWGVGRGVTA